MPPYVSPYARAGPALNMAELGRITGGSTEPNNPLYNVGKFLSRPMFAVQSALRGEFGDAGENLLQMALDVPTGGFLNRNWSLANLLPEDVAPGGDLTTKAERPEFTDLARSWGMGLPSSGATKLALDVAGGMALDPLTYLTFGTSALAKGALSSMARTDALAKVAHQLTRTGLGRKALTSAEGAVAARFTASTMPEPMVLRRLATEEVLGNALGRPGFRVSGELAQAPVMDAGIEALEAKGLAQRHGEWRLGLPFTQGVPLSELGIRGTEKVKLRQATAPWLAHRVLKTVAPTVAEEVAVRAGEGWNMLKAKLYDRTLLGNVPEGVRHAMRQGNYKHARQRVEAKQVADKLWDGYSVEQREVIKQAWDEAGDAWDAHGDYARARNEALDKISAPGTGIDRTKADRTLTAYDDSMKKIQEQLPGLLPDWELGVAREFYVPHQAEAQLADLMSASLGNEKLTENLRILFRDQFTRGRTHKSLPEFQAALNQFVTDNGLDDVAKSMGQVLDVRDMKELHLTRMLAHAKTVHARTLWNQAKAKWSNAAGIEPNVARYLNGQLEPLGLRQNMLGKLLGGGEFKTPAPPGGKFPPDVLKQVANTKEWRLGKDGAIYKKWRGLNYWIKPALTSHPQNVSFHFRNAFSSLLMGFLDPDVGAAGVWGMLEGTGTAMLVRKLGVDWRPGEVATFLRASRGDEAAMVALKGRKVGQANAQEVARQLRSFVGERTSQADLMQELHAGGNVIDRWTALGERMANHMESSYRANAYLALIKKGVEPTEAMTRVERAFVKYDINSTVERALRDTLPFARFTIGSAAWLAKYAQRPRLLTPVSRMQQSAQDEEALLPPSVRAGIGLPLPWKDEQGNQLYATSLGLPQEAAFSAADALTSFEGLRRSGLGALNPPLKYPLEQAVNRNFYFGDEAGLYRRRPAWVPEALAQEIDTPAGKRYEVPGWFNDLMSALPTSRALKLADAAMDDKKGKIHRLVRSTTGVRTLSVDQRRAAAKVLANYLEREEQAGRVGQVPAFFSRMGEDTPEDLKLALKALREFRKKEE